MSAVLLGGHSANDAAKAVENCQLLNKTTRGLLYWVLREPADQLSVNRIRSAFGMGEKAWVTQREILRQIGVLTQKKTVLENKTSLWSLNFDFRPLFASLPEGRGGDHVRDARARTHARNPRVLMGSRSPKKGGDHARGVNKKIQGTGNTAPPSGGKGSGGPVSGEGEFNNPCILPHGGGLQNSISKNLEAKKFFAFLNQYGIDFVRIESIFRKNDGTRGAPLGSIFLENSVQKANTAIHHFDKLARRLQTSGKRNFDLLTGAAEDADKKSRALLIDDLDKKSITKLKQKWTGAAAFLETSLGNFQAILVADLPLDRNQRVQIQKSIAGEFQGDSGAVSSTQLHRLPGSINWSKNEFVCRLFEVRHAVKESNESDFLTKEIQSAVYPKVQTKVTQYSAKNGLKTNSEIAFGRTIQMLREGHSREEIIEFLSRPEWITHHTKDWPERTWRAAMDKFRPASKRLH